MGKKKKAENKNNVKPEFIDTIWYQITPVITAVLGLILLFFYIFSNDSGTVGVAVKNLLFGLFSWGALFIPLCLIKQTVTWKKDIEKHKVGSNTVYEFVLIILIAVFAHTIAGISNVDLAKEMNLKALYESGMTLKGGGAVGGWIAAAITSLIGSVPTLIISLTGLLLFVIFVVGLTPMRIAELISASIKKKKEKLNAEAQVRAEERKKREAEERAEAEKRAKEEQKQLEKEEKAKQKSKVMDGLVGEEEQQSQDEEIHKASESTSYEEPENSENKPLDLDEIFVNKENLELSRKILGSSNDLPQSVDMSIDVSNDTDGKNDTAVKTADQQLSDEESPIVGVEEEQTAPKEYQFPPISFLAKDTVSKEDLTSELEATGSKLVKILESYGIGVSIVNISRGPTVTRYELQPDVGVKVRSISNLVDDIALHLAANGSVRIEAPIPGKSAVGVEIPNKTGTMVRLRGLIENPEFANCKSKITAVLGEDVAGKPLYMNIAKMPHLLIAGATGMGKSVCINSIIMSILYKARPDEVKFILVDPKKVELNVYEKIPHLIVPVMSDPKQASGALRWAVGEMERRFGLMEECGARNLEGYNDVAKNDPDLEVLPEIVIIIDELADLMMMAPTVVEDSICRIAQKARAAGMHLIIGTQRPSVDVITGLIKANIPSRIAFTVASQVDSRTIIDIAGAEKLCGKGDMLYAPVGITKPLRAQGSFVSTEEVEKVCEFLRQESESAYDDEVAKAIEKEAENCVVKGAPKIKGDDGGASKGDDGACDNSDELLNDAIEMAVDAGQNGISTSMLQRRLSVGYARAGRLIDTMQQMGIVGGFEGSKPRKVLITREQYLEMKMNGNNFSQNGGEDA